MSFNPYAVKIYVDGSCRKNPGGSGGFSAWLEYPADWNRANEEVEYVGFFETNNQRMELRACIFAHELVCERAATFGVELVQVITDSIYVSDNYNRAIVWSQNRWRNRHERPLENKDLWKRLLSVRRMLRVRVEVKWTKGKRSGILKAVDRSARKAASLPSRVDRGFPTGKIGRPKNNVKGAARLFPASGQEALIRIYYSVAFPNGENKLKFQSYSEAKMDFFDKFTAYSNPEVGAQLHRQHKYVVRFNSVPEYPRIEEVVREVTDTNTVEECVV